MISSLFFPADVSWYFSEEKYDGSILSENERELAKTYGTKRFTDFCTGRFCMRQATASLGFTGDILIGERGMPLLPGNITASLSHSKKISGAIAGHKDNYLSLGIDIETCGRVKQDMWYLLFTENELLFLNDKNEEQIQFYATAFFSLKEAFYKMQYPLTCIYLDFPEVEVVVTNDQYYVKPLRHVAGLFTEGRLFPGQVIRYKEQVVTYLTLPAGAVAAN